MKASAQVWGPSKGWIQPSSANSLEPVVRSAVTSMCIWPSGQRPPWGCELQAVPVALPSHTSPVVHEAQAPLTRGGFRDLK